MGSDHNLLMRTITQTQGGSITKTGFLKVHLSFFFLKYIEREREREERTLVELKI